MGVAIACLLAFLKALDRVLRSCEYIMHKVSNCKVITLLNSLAPNQQTLCSVFNDGGNYFEVCCADLGGRAAPVAGIQGRKLQPEVMKEAIRLLLCAEQPQANI